mmetsp:Transcript_17818/g.36625  ORF Transcript_17818/g.36625 Transcript_17818/m.36625 type:complete len:229 (+) Transcript_17818:304-990(+)
MVPAVNAGTREKEIAFPANERSNTRLKSCSSTGRKGTVRCSGPLFFDRNHRLFGFVFDSVSRHESLEFRSEARGFGRVVLSTAAVFPSPLDVFQFAIQPQSQPVQLFVHHPLFFLFSHRCFFLSGHLDKVQPRKLQPGQRITGTAVLVAAAASTKSRSIVSGPVLQERPQSPIALQHFVDEGLGRYQQQQGENCYENRREQGIVGQEEHRRVDFVTAAGQQQWLRGKG